MKTSFYLFLTAIVWLHLLPVATQPVASPVATPVAPPAASPVAPPVAAPAPTPDAPPVSRPSTFFGFILDVLDIIASIFFGWFDVLLGIFGGRGRPRDGTAM